MVILKGADSGESRRPLGGTTSQGRSCFPDPRAVCQLDIVKRRGYMDSELRAGGSHKCTSGAKARFSELLKRRYSRALMCSPPQAMHAMPDTVHVGLLPSTEYPMHADACLHLVLQL